MLKIIGSLLIISLNLFALVEAKLNSQNVNLGENVTLTLSGNGQNVVFPELNEIAGFEVEAVATSQNISILNGKQSINISKSFTFTPTKSITIPALEIEVDGKKELTNELKLEVSTQTTTQNANSGEAEFLFEVNFDKKEAYVGEPIKMTLLFKRLKNIEVLDIEYSQINFPNFWAKQIGKEQAYQDKNYIVHKLDFILFPQKAGNIELKPLKIKVATPKKSRDIFGFWIKSPEWKTMFSNENSFNIKDIPSDVKVVGDFNIEATVDKNTIKVNEPLNLTLKVSGVGNIDSLEDYSLNLDGAIVYADKALKDYKFEGEKYGGVYIKKFAIISGENFTIPSFSLKYFDLKTEQVKEIKTKEFNIEVNGSKIASKEVKLETLKALSETNQTALSTMQTSNFDKLFYFLIGLVSGIILVLSLKLIKIDFKVKEVKFSLKDRDLLKLLIPFVSKNQSAKELVLKLEENIYQGKKHKISKKEVTKLLNEIN